MFVQCDGHTRNKKRCGNNSKFVAENNKHYCGVHIKQIPDKTFQEYLLECIVCYNHVSLNMAVETACHHVFCKSCLNKWLRRNHTCPLCRSALRNQDYELPYEDMESMAHQFITRLVQNNHIVFQENNFYITVDLSDDQRPLLEQWNNHVATIDYLVYLLP